MQDMQGYRAVWREPLSMDALGLTILVRIWFGPAICALRRSVGTRW